MSRYAAIVFDLDGTLLNSHDMIARTVNKVLAGRAYPTAETRDILAMTGLPIEDVFQSVLPSAAQEEALACVDEYRVIFNREVIPAVEPIHGAREMLHTVSTFGIPLGVATGRMTDSAHAMLTKTGLLHHFVAALGADAAARPKPYPDLLLEVLRQLGDIDPADAIVVGDGAADVAMAHAAGSPVVAVTWGAQPRDVLLQADPRWCVDSFEELLAILAD